MNINATIIIQVLHFLCAYGIVRFILLKPAVAQIHKDDDEQKVLQESIVQETQSIKSLEDVRINLWRSCQEYFKSNKPQQVHARMPHYRDMSLSLHVPTESERAQMVAEMEQRLVQKLGTPYGS